jgi:hypothetical protein
MSGRGTRACPAPLRSGIDIHLERDVAGYHTNKGSERPVPLYKRESRFAQPPAPPRSKSLGSLGPSQATLSKMNFQYSTTQRENVLAMTDAEMAVIRGSQSRACRANKSNSLTSDPFCAKRADGSLLPRVQKYATTQSDTKLSVTKEQAKAYMKEQTAACRANKANSLTSQPLR